MLSSKENNIPTQLNTELGIYWKGTYTNNKDDETKKTPQSGEDAIYLSYGFIEDVIFNGELAKYASSAEQFTGGDAIEFDSSISYTFWSNTLYERQQFLKNNTKLPFLFPEQWDDTYNTRLGKTPDRTDEDNLRTPLRGSALDKRQFRIPIREVFIKLAVVKQAIKQADTMSEVFNFIFKKMAESTGYIWDWHLNSSDVTNTRLGVVDRNYKVKQIENNDAIKEDISGEDYFNDMFMFEPFSPNSIVKGFSLNLSPGDGSAISSKLALQSLGKAGRNIFATSEIIDQTQTSMVVEDLEDDGTYKSIYNVEYFPPGEGNSDLEKIFAAFESTDEESNINQDFLSSENIYGGGEKSFSTIAKNSKNYKNASRELLEKMGEEGDLQPAIKPTIEYRKHKAVLENSNYEFCDNIYDYFTKKHLTTTVASKPTILPMKLSLDIHGFTGLQPSDKFRINHIPTRYLNFVFFQIMRITHTVGPGAFTTNLECVMRIRDDVKEQLPINTKKVNVMSPSVLNTQHKLKEVAAIIPFISYMAPNIPLQQKANSRETYKNDINDVHYVYDFMTLPTASGKTNFMTSQIESTFSVQDEDEIDVISEADEFQLDLEIITAKIPEYEVKQVVKDETISFKCRYNLAANTHYELYINGDKFLIRQPDKTLLGVAQVPQYFARLNGQWPGLNEYNKANK